MRNNNQTNSFIKWAVILFDFVLLGCVLALFAMFHPHMSAWQHDRVEVFVLTSAIGLVFCEFKFPTIIHERLISAGEILKRVVMITTTQAVLSYLLMKVIDLRLPVGYLLLEIGTCLFVLMLMARFIERSLVKRYRQLGRNTRTMVFVGSDPELDHLYEKLISDATTGYRLLGYYGEPNDGEVKRLGSLQDLIEKLGKPGRLVIGEDMYVCLSRRERETVMKLSRYCDQHMIRFYYVPMSVETLGINLKRELVDDIEVFSTYEMPLANPVRKMIKRLFDVVLSLLFLLLLLPFFPIIALLIKIQSPGPIFFKQLRTGLDGKDFVMYKFRSMHVNKDADKVQATKNDPRKYAFGSFMRKMNIDEMPQFWNVLRGEMSIVGPRPHMLAHTEMYSQLIDKYMVRHFVKPGVTGWAQVTGFRGETQELWQMEGRVKRDIWYMENWSIWLDFRIMWLTAKSLLIHDANAY